MTNTIDPQLDGHISQPDHHDLGRIIGSLSCQGIDHLDRSTSGLWHALNENLPIDTQTMCTPIRSNIAAMRSLLDQLEVFVSQVDSTTRLDRDVSV